MRQLLNNKSDASTEENLRKCTQGIMNLIKSRNENEMENVISKP